VKTWNRIVGFGQEIIKIERKKHEEESKVFETFHKTKIIRVSTKLQLI
jgi:hypothetical protein